MDVLFASIVNKAKSNRCHAIDIMINANTDILFCVMDHKLFVCVCAVYSVLVFRSMGYVGRCILENNLQNLLEIQHHRLSYRLMAASKHQTKLISILELNISIIWLFSTL